MQRLFDVIFSGLTLVILAPLLIPIAIVLGLTGEGYIFFLQDRIGQHGKIFKLYKFATMLKNSPNLLTGTITIKNDPRILPIGNFLRKTKVNELPQLLNVLFGDMSIVGPRPLTEQTFGLYSLGTQRAVQKVRPGLSGIGSIIFRSEESILTNKKNALKFYSQVIAPYKGSLEEWYVQNNNLKIYFLIIIFTIWIVLFRSLNIVWKIFHGLPIPPKELRLVLDYSN
jgi:lipopolysaccharide/colanic/teichoic acid biosynthesis glycosyltransferase